MLFYGAPRLKGIALPDGVTSVGNNAFSTCISLKELALGAELLNAGCGLTEFCVALEKITVSENNESFSDEGNCLTRKADNTVIAGCASSKIPAGTGANRRYSLCRADAAWRNRFSRRVEKYRTLCVFLHGTERTQTAARIAKNRRLRFCKLHRTRIRANPRQRD